MKRTELLREIRMMRFAEVFSSWNAGKLTQEEAAQILGVCGRTFRRQIQRYEEHGPDGLLDKRISQASNRLAPVDEVVSMTEKYRSLHQGWNVKHFHAWYQRDGGRRSYTWVKLELQKAGLVTKAHKRGAHRKKRERMPLPGMLIHQDGSRHEWVAGKKWDLIVTMDDATNEHYSIFFCEEEGTASSFNGVREVIETRGLFSSFYSDRGSHYWITPEAGGKVDKHQLTQFGRALQNLGISMIAAYSPQARGRSERAFRTHQERLPKELALRGITSMDEANRYLADEYQLRFNAEFKQSASEAGTAFIPWIGSGLEEILCEQHERTVTPDNCVSFEGMKLQIPPDKHRCHYVRVKVRVHRHCDGSLAIFHGPRKLAEYTGDGDLVSSEQQPMVANSAALR